MVGVEGVVVFLQISKRLHHLGGLIISFNVHIALMGFAC